MKSKAIESDPDKCGGQPVFVGTRVLVSLLFAELAGGHDIRYFLEGYPNVTEEQVLTVIKDARKALLEEPDIIQEIQTARDAITQTFIEELNELREVNARNLTRLAESFSKKVNG